MENEREKMRYIIYMHVHELCWPNPLKINEKKTHKDNQLIQLHVCTMHDIVLKRNRNLSKKIYVNHNCKSN